MTHVDFDYVFALRMNYEEEFNNETDIIIELIHDLKEIKMDRNEIPIFLKNFYENVGIDISEKEIYDLLISTEPIQVESQQVESQQVESLQVVPQVESLQVEHMVSLFESLLRVPLGNIAVGNVNIPEQVDNVSVSDISDNNNNSDDDDDLPDLVDNNNNIINYNIQPAIVRVGNRFGINNDIFNILFQHNPHNVYNNNNNQDVVASLSTTDMDNLNKYKLEKSLDDPCSICKTSMDTDEEVYRLECGHIHHSECIEPWFKQYNYKCPMCRQEVGKPKYNNIS